MDEEQRDSLMFSKRVERIGCQYERAGCCICLNISDASQFQFQISQAEEDR
jgi:hypothetical protein